MAGKSGDDDKERDEVLKRLLKTPPKPRGNPTTGDVDRKKPHSAAENGGKGGPCGLAKT